MPQHTYKIGFANLMSTQPFALLVQESLEKAAKDAGLELIVRHNELNNDLARQNIREFVEIPVDLAIIFHLDERFNVKLSEILRKKHIPIIAQDIPMPMATYFGANNSQAGILAGEELGKWVKANWNSKIDKILILTDSRILEEQQKRLKMALNGLEKFVPVNRNHVLHLDTEINEDLTRERTANILKTWEDAHHIVMVGINDEMTLCGLEAAQNLGRRAHVIGVGHGATRLEQAFSDPDSRFLGSVAYYPDRYGTPLIKLALRILAGERVPPRNYMEHVCITRDNLYLLNAEGGAV